MNPSTSASVRGDLDVHWDSMLEAWPLLRVDHMFVTLTSADERFADTSGREAIDPFCDALRPDAPRRGFTMWLLLSEVDDELEWYWRQQPGTRASIARDDAAGITVHPRGLTWLL